MVDNVLVDSGDTSFLPDWSAFRTVQNHLTGILIDSTEEKSVAVAALIVNSLNRVFVDLCSDVPWDKDQLINNARKSIHGILIELLKKIDIALKDGLENSGSLLWEGYSKFEFHYNKILRQLNIKDQNVIEEMISSYK